MPTSGIEPPTFRLQGERNNHYATQAIYFLYLKYCFWSIFYKSKFMNNSKIQRKFILIEYFIGNFSFSQLFI